MGRFGNKSGATSEDSTCSHCPKGLYAGLGSGECKTCGRGFVTNEDQSACVLCSGNTYVSADGMSCLACGPFGMDCSDGIIKLKPGWWYSLAREKRLGRNGLNALTSMFPCFESAHCGAVNETMLLCGDNSGGPLCAVCNEGYVPDKATRDGSCKICAQSIDTRWGNKYLIIAIGACAFFVYAFFVVTRPKPQLKMSTFLGSVLYFARMSRLSCT